MKLNEKYYLNHADILLNDCADGEGWSVSSNFLSYIRSAHARGGLARWGDEVKPSSKCAICGVCGSVESHRACNRDHEFKAVI